jgi:hypothetical protein
MQNLSEDLHKGNPDLSLEEKIAAFGSEAIPLIIPYGSKGKDPTGPFKKYMNNWSNRTRADTLKPEYQADLYSERPKNVAIRQGGGLTRIVAFDIDSNDPRVQEELFSKYPLLAKTIQTIGQRGLTTWFICSGDFVAKQATIEVRGEKVEWRGSKYSIIHGQHPISKKDYQFFLNEGLQTLPNVDEPPGPDWKNWPSVKPKSDLPKIPKKPLPAWIAKARAQVVEKNYQVLEWMTSAKARVTCVNEAQHTDDTGEGQCVIYTGADELGAISYHCLHQNHCQATNDIESAKLARAFQAIELIILPKDTTELAAIFEELFKRMKHAGTFFGFGESDPYLIRRWYPGLKEPRKITKDKLAEELGLEGLRFGKIQGQEPNKYVKACLPDKEIKAQIMVSAATEMLPRYTTLVPHPVPTIDERNGKFQILSREYAPKLEMIITGENNLPELDFEHAVKTLNWFLSFWPFTTSIDRARAWSELLTPALLQGGFLDKEEFQGCKAPAFLLMANLPDAGKTHFHIRMAGIYNHPLEVQSYSDAKIGGSDEIIKGNLARGLPFSCLDNLRGEINSVFLESLLTGGNSLSIRMAYTPLSDIRLPRMILLLSGNTNFSVTPDMASRAVVINLTKDPARNWKLPDGTSLELWALRNQRLLLGSVFSIIKRWVEGGCCQESNDGFRFMSWASAINGILTKVLGLEPVTKGLKEAQAQSADPYREMQEALIGSLREKGYLWNGNGAEAYGLSDTRIIELIEETGFEVPGVNPYHARNCPVNYKRGKLLKYIRNLYCVKNSDNAIFQISNIFVIRKTLLEPDQIGHSCNTTYYIFTVIPEVPINFTRESVSVL